MSTLTETVTMSTTTATKADKKIKQMQKKIVILRLSPSLLAQFAPKSLSRSNSTVKSDPDSAATPNLTTNGDIPQNGTPADNVSESNSTPAPNGESNNDDSKKKGGPGSKGGVKRTLGESAAKSRSRPGPKKRPRLEEEAGGRTSFTGAVPAGPHKLGPKANQGAINAGLRALDRSGKPCRKWEKKPFSLKSFTGVSWDLPSWRAPQLPKEELTNGDMNGVSNSTDGDNKPVASSTGLQSEKSNQGDVNDRPDPMALSTPAASSPPPAATSPAAAPPAITVEAEA